MPQKLCERYSDIYHREDLETYDDIIYENCILFDSRLDDYLQDIAKTLTSNTFILWYDFDIESYTNLKNKLKGIIYNNDVQLINISFLQHNDTETKYYHQFVKSDTIYFYEKPLHKNFKEFKNFCSFLATDIQVKNLDLMMCKIYSDDNWKTAIQFIEEHVQSLNIRSSEDNTGHVLFEGDWVLESESDEVNMIGLYFTEQIKDIEIILGDASSNGFLSAVSSFDGLLDVSAVCVLDISVSTVSELFSVQLDVSNIEDISMSTCSFGINYDASSESFSDISFSLASVKSGNASTGYIDQRVYKDIIRKITKQVTGSTRAADLFTNESEVATIVKNTDISLCDNLNDIIENVNAQGFKTVSEYEALSISQYKRFYAMAHTLLAFTLDASGDYPTPYQNLKTNIENEYTNNNDTLPITVKYGFTEDQYIVVRISYFPSSDSLISFSDINYKCLLHLV